MSARKWAYYDLEVGGLALVINPPRRFGDYVRRWGEEKGRRFSVCRWERENPTLVVVRRIA